VSKEANEISFFRTFVFYQAPPMCKIGDVSLLFVAFPFHGFSVTHTISDKEEEKKRNYQNDRRKKQQQTPTCVCWCVIISPRKKNGNK